MNFIKFEKIVNKTSHQRLPTAAFFKIAAFAGVKENVEWVMRFRDTIIPPTKKWVKIDHVWVDIKIHNVHMSLCDKLSVTSRILEEL
jgi:hypothetical protein